MLVGVAVTLAVLVGAVGATVLARGGRSSTATSGLAGAELSDLGSRPAATERMPLPDLTVAGFGDGQPVKLSDYRGLPLVVNFWATWCTPCVVEMPDFQQVAGEVADQAQFLGVNVQDAPANAEAFVRRLGIDYDLASDPAGKLYAEVRAYGMPTTLLVDPSGMVVYRHTGALDAAGLRELLQVHLDVQGESVGL